MGRKPSPWWWDEEQGWYVNYQGKRRFLGKHPDGARKPQKSDKTGKWNAPKLIEDAFLVLLGGGEPVPQPTPAGDSVQDVLKDFVKWARENRATLTAERYKQFLEDFINATVDKQLVGLLPVPTLTSKHVTAWLNRKETWGPTTKKNAITAVQAALNWATANRGLDRNPIKGMKKPEAKRRKGVVTPAEFEAILGKVTGPFADLLTVSYDCGARPFELKDLELRHVDFDKRRAVIPADEAKGRKHTRTIYFPTDRSLEIVRRLCAERAEGPIFRNSRGNKWTGNAVKCYFARLEKIIGKRVKHYDFRRTFITRKIIAGVDSHVVAKLSGHQSTAMIDRHYSAVADDSEFMLKQAERDIKGEEE